MPIPTPENAKLLAELMEQTALAADDNFLVSNISITKRTTFATVYNSLKNLYGVGYGIVETGSNTNGTWIKFSDGTMIQYGSFITAGNGGTDYTGYRTYPVTFTTKPDYTIGNAWSGYHGAGISSANQIALVNNWTDKFFYAVRFIGATSSSYNIVYNWTAIGRWK